MTFFKNVWNKISRPKLWMAILFYIAFGSILSATIALVVLKQDQTVWHFLLYILSAISLTYFVYTIVYFAPKIKSKTIELMQKHKFTKTLLNDYGYRTVAFSIFSFVLNISYVVFVAVLAFMTRSAWYISITTYHLILILMKGNIFISKKKHNTEVKKARAYKYCGIMFLFLTIALSGIIVLIYTSNMYFEYAGLMIYVVAVITFYKLTLSIYNIFKARKQDDLYIQSIRNTNLVSALVSVVVLQVAMFQAFSPEYNTSFANGLTGGLISAIILSLAIYMIVTSNKKLKLLEIKNEEQ